MWWKVEFNHADLDKNTYQIEATCVISYVVQAESYDEAREIAFSEYNAWAIEGNSRLINGPIVGYSRGVRRIVKLDYPHEYERIEIKNYWVREGSKLIHGPFV